MMFVKVMFGIYLYLQGYAMMMLKPQMDDYIQKYAKQEWMIRVVNVIQYIYCGIVFVLGLLMLYSSVFRELNVQAIVSVYIVSSALVIGITVHTIRLSDVRRDIISQQLTRETPVRQDERIPFVVRRVPNYDSYHILGNSFTLDEQQDKPVLTM